MSQPKDKARELHLSAIWNRVRPVLPLLLMGLIATALVARYTSSAEQAAEKRNFDAVCGEIQIRILERLKGCETLLRSGAAFFQHEGHVSREEWHRFVGFQQLERRFPGVQGIGYAQLVPRRELTQHLERIRDEGFPTYQVRPAGERDVYSSIIYLEPFAGRNLRAFGYDMLSEPVRREAMSRARDENTATLSGKVILVQETSQDIQTGTLMYMPVFRRELPTESVLDRRAALLGWVYSPYRMDDLLEGIVGVRNLSQDRHIRLTIFDGGTAAPEALLYDSSASGERPTGGAPSLTLQSRIVPAGRPWTLHFARTDQQLSFWDSKVWLVWLGGTSTSLLLSGLLISLLTIQARVRHLAERLTRDLKVSEEKFRAIADYTVGWEMWFGLDGKILWMNPGVEQITGYSPAEVSAMPDFISTIFATEDRGAFGAIANGSTPHTRGSDMAFKCIKKDGSPFWLNISWQPILDRNNLSLGLRASGRDITALKQAEADLRRANWVLEQANTSILITDRQARIEYVNAAFTKSTGYTKDEVTGLNPRFLQSGQTSRGTYAEMWRCLVAGRSWQGEFLNRKKNGDCFWETVAISPLRDSAGHITHYVGIKQDVSERKQLQAALKESNDRLYLAAQAGGVGIWDHHVLDNRLIWDDQMFRLHGITRDQFSGAYDAWRNGVHPDDQWRVDAEIQLALRGEKTFNTEFRVVWPDRSIHDIRALALVQRDASGQPVRMIGTNWDITAEKLVAAKLHWNQELLQLMASSSPLGFLVVDNRTDAILHSNQRFCEIWGIEHLADRLRRGELKNGDIIPDCLPRLADVPAFAASCIPLQQESDRMVLEDEIAFVGGRTIRRYSTQIRDAADRYYGRFYIFEDISERKHREAVTAALLEKEKAISEMRTRFISTTSHEFRTPMAAAMASSDLLFKYFDRFTPEKRQELLTRINSSLQRMAGMLDEILLLNRLEEHRVKVQLAPIDLRHFMRDLIEEIRLGDHDRHRFELHSPDDVVPFVTDSNLLHHIFSNVLSNAVRYSPASTTVSVRMVADPMQIKVEVEDRGIGILPADRARIFDPFERGSNVGAIQGTGLGLNIVKRMTDMMDGTVAVGPVEGGGTRFTLVFSRPSAPSATS